MKTPVATAAWGRLGSLPVWVLVAFGAASLILRLLYGIFIMDPMSGPDAPTYVEAGPAVAERGPFSTNIPGVPYWPVGYPALLAVPVLVAPSQWLTVAVVGQVLLLMVAIVATRQIALTWAGPSVANASYLILLVLPSLTAAAAQLMYEVPLASLLAIWAWFISRSIEGARHEGGGRLYTSPLMAILGGLILGLAVTVQSKVLPLIIVSVVVLFGVTKLWTVALSALSTLFIPFSLALANVSNYGHFGLSWNLGTTMSIRNDGRVSGCPQGTDLFSRDSALTRCNLELDLSSPLETLRLYFQQFLWHFWPLSGPQSPGSTWFHGLSPWRIVPPAWRETALGPSLTWVAAAIVIAALVVPFLVGLVSARRLSWRITLLLASAPVLLALVSIVVRGDGRFRIPGDLLATPIWVVGLVAICSIVFRRHAWIPKAPLTVAPNARGPDGAKSGDLRI